MERERIILSTVRRNVEANSSENQNTSTKLGFLKDIRRANVALTRARRHLIIFGDRECLK